MKQMKIEMDDGYMSSIGLCFDVGMTVSTALRRYQKTGDPYAGSRARHSSGNGSIMRMAPVPIFYQNDEEKAVYYGGESSRTTHSSELCIDACQYFSLLLVSLIQGRSKEVFRTLNYQPQTEEVAEIKSGGFLDKSYDALTGSGYVIESLESALWCFLHTESFADCILAAANLGNDADTTAAVAGQIAGAFYGHAGIRHDWLEALHLHNEIVLLADELYLAASRQPESSDK